MFYHSNTNANQDKWVQLQSFKMNFGQIQYRAAGCGQSLILCRVLDCVEQSHAVVATATSTHIFIVVVRLKGIKDKLAFSVTVDLFTSKNKVSDGFTKLVVIRIERLNKKKYLL